MSIYDSIKYDTYYLKGMKDQDTHLVIDTCDYKIFGVFDGHGTYGQEYVISAKEKFAEKLVKLDFSKEINSQIITIFNEINAFLELPKYVSTGCTVSFLIITKEKMYVVTVGDSDIYIFDEEHNLEILNNPHGGTNEEEMKRLKEFPNTTINFATTTGKFTDPVWTDDKMIPIDASKYQYFKNRMNEPAIYICSKLVPHKLAMTRSLGDYGLKSHGIICTPEIKEFPFPKSKSQVLIASDGFWDSWKKEELITELSDIEKRKNVHKTSVELSTFYFGKSSMDDNTLIHLFF